MAPAISTAGCRPAAWTAASTATRPPTSRRAVLTGTVRVELPPGRAFHLFTPVGERLWAEGWDPSFPAGESGDGAEPGTVFLTGAHGRTTIWTVLDRTAEGVRYARTTPGHIAGSVAVRLRATADGATSAEVAYDLTALTPDAEPELADFASGYEAFMAQWEREIGSVVAAGRV